jgi:hypothetical protein
MDKELFLKMVGKYIKRDGIDNLLEWLETTDWYTAPASTKYHLSKEGGLLKHSLNVYNRLAGLYEMEYDVPVIPDEKMETLAIISLFHDFCKINCYKEEWKNVKVYKENGSKYDNGGNFDWETQKGYVFDEKFVYGYHGAKSVFLIERFIKLTPEEAVCIANHMGAYDRPNGDYSIGNVFQQNPLAFLLHTADCTASFIDEK